MTAHTIYGTLRKNRRALIEKSGNVLAKKKRSHAALTQLSDERNIFIAECELKIADCVVRKKMYIS